MYLIIFGVITFLFVALIFSWTMRQPLLSAKGKIIGQERSKGGAVLSYYLYILFVDKSITRFCVSRKQYFTVKKYDIVDITSKGYHLISIKKQNTQNVIMNEEIGLKESDLIHAKPMKLDNKDTTKYDKWIAKEKKEAAKKGKKVVKL